MGKYYIIAIVGGSVLVIALCVLLSFFLFRKKRFVRQIKSLDEKYNDYHTQLTSDCNVMINRLGALGKFNIKYQNLFNERKKQYDDIMENRDNIIRNSIHAINSCIDGKDFKKAKLLMSQTNVAVEEFVRSVSSFNEDLTNLLRDDSDTSEASLSVKDKYHKIRSFYDENKTELKPLEQSFELIFQNAEKTFGEYATYTDRAEFDKAKNLLPPLDTLLSSLLSIMDDLLKFETLINNIIPEKLKSLSDTYFAMVKAGYDLKNLNVPQIINAMNDSLKKLKDQLLYLDVRGVGEKLESMQSNIADILVKFENEKKAKEKFNKSQDIIQTSTYTLEKEYSKHMNQLQNYMSTYVLDTKYVEHMKSLRNDIESISYLKRELDSYIDTSDKQPYSLICQKMDEMQKKTEKVRMVMTDYSDYLESLKSTSQSVYNGLRDYYILLKKASYQVKCKISVPNFTNSLHEEFKNLFDEIARIDNIILTQPIDVNKAKEAFAPFASRCDSLINYINKKAEECKGAEAAIVYANAYRMDYTDSRPMLDKAEKSFYDGNFDKAKDEAMKVLNTFKSSGDPIRNN